MMSRLWVAGALFCAASAVIQPTSAHDVKKQYDLGQMAAAADLVFRGQVTEVAYRDSQASENRSGLPHTFVTYAVQEVLYGNYSGKTITLRFLGGQTVDGKVMLSVNSPQFSADDQDILFVQGNGSSECPLVDCANGRIRIVDGQLYNDDGQALLENDQGQIVRGAKVERAELQKFNIGNRRYERQHHERPAMDDVENEAVAAPVEGTPLDIASFGNKAMDRFAQQLPKDPRGLTKATRSLNPKAVFAIESAKPVAMPEPKRPMLNRVPLNAQDQAEQEAQTKRGGDPVLD